jgi:hypothetical protein
MRRNGFERYHSLIQVGYFLILTHFGQDAAGLLTDLSPAGVSHYRRHMARCNARP